MAEYPSAVNPAQFKEHLALRQQLGNEIGINRRLHPLPPEYAASKRSGSMFDAHSDVEGMNNSLRAKIATTVESNTLDG